MVHGLEKFKEYFKNHTSQYVFIGGTACDIIMDDLGATFRATKDLDMVLILGGSRFIICRNLLAIHRRWRI
ncbi:MAG: hypothetical protein NUK57_04430 [Gudongella sp.]|nr:hypothetical protein [Gudongella sp.]